MIGFLFCGIAFLASVKANLNSKMHKMVTTYNSTAASAYVGNMDYICDSGSAGYGQRDKVPEFDLNGRLSMGSNTKSMTAATVAILLESSSISAKFTRGWNTTLLDIFPDLAAYTAFAGVTLAQVAGHFSGLDANPPQGFWAFQNINPTPTLIEQRRNITASAFLSTPTSTPGTSYLYSNWGMVVLGHVIEVWTGRVWEDVITEVLIHPLKMTGDDVTMYPFGAVEDNWGHMSISASIPHLPCDPRNPPKIISKITPGFKCDNPANMGPAGTYSGPILGMYNYYSWMLKCAAGQNTQSTVALSTNGCRTLQTPYGPLSTDPSNTMYYGYGWGFYLLDNGTGGIRKVITHTGSNTYNIADVYIIPEDNRIYWAGTNSGTDTDMAMIKQIITDLQTMHFESC